jgi:hypothetical protein
VKWGPVARIANPNIIQNITFNSENTTNKRNMQKLSNNLLEFGLALFFQGLTFSENNEKVMLSSKKLTRLRSTGETIQHRDNAPSERRCSYALKISYKNGLTITIRIWSSLKMLASTLRRSYNSLLA